MKNQPAIDAYQGDLFSGLGLVSGLEANNIDNGDRGSYTKEVLDMPDAKVIFYKGFFGWQESNSLFKTLLDETHWRQDSMNIYGKVVNLPRKTAWYGDPDRSYTFSGIHLNPEPWTSTLLKIKKQIEENSDVAFNSVLLNLYRHGQDGISWHTDAEAELGENPIIGSVSFGETRRFMFRHKHDKDLKAEVELTHGSFLLMANETQHFWQHQVPKTAKQLKPRINLTFRTIID
jgi:alkylated DNA repair dioxygenase AlkB